MVKTFYYELGFCPKFWYIGHIMESKVTKTYTLQTPITEALRDEIDALAKERRWSRAETSRYLMERGLQTESTEAKAA